MGKSVLLLRTLELLRTSDGITLEELANELERSERTVYRYLSELSYDLQTPIFCYEGKYRLTARSEAAGVFHLTADEALAAHVALSSTAVSCSGPFSAAAKSALRKITSSIRNHAFDQLQDSQSKHLIAPTVFGDGRIDCQTACLICEAINTNKQAKVVYRSQKSAKIEDLLIDPYGLAFRRHSWYVVAHSHNHQRVIQLKLVRFKSAELTGETFSRPADFSLQDYYNSSWEVWAGGKETEVLVKLSARVAPMMRENQYHPSQTLEDTEDGGVILTVKVAGTEEIGTWILSYGDEAEVLSPPELRERVKETALRMCKRYSREEEG